jgi:hypothetical protein
MNQGFCTPNITVNSKPPKLRHLGKTEGKTKRNRIRNQTIRIGQKIMPFKEKKESAQRR